jgi:hypothetical protein
MPQAQTEQNKKNAAFRWAHVWLNVLSKLLAIPLFIFIYRLLPFMQWPWHLDKILLFILVSILLFVVFRFFEKSILLLSAAALLFLGIGSAMGPYGFRHLYQDYRAMIYSMIYDPVPVALRVKPIRFFPNEKALVRAVDYPHPQVRDFSLQAVNEHFKEVQRGHTYRTLIQSLAVFKAINTQWHYVNDPKSRDYFAKASESVRYLSGDCDDHSTCMAACIKAIGGRVRLILTTRHLYPELYVGTKNDFDHLHLLIRKNLFVRECSGKALHYHVDAEGKIWINLDYTASYPGGPFMAQPVLGVLNL